MMPARSAGFGRLIAVTPESNVHLQRSADRAVEVEALVSRLGGRAGLAGVLGDLNRTAHRVRVPAPAAAWGFRWDHDDLLSRRWWPQGITTSADAGDGVAGDLGGRAILVTSSYAHVVDGVHRGARLSFVDLTDRDDIRFLHVAGTARGFSSFRLSDLVAVPAHHSTRLRVRGDRVEAFGYRYLLPVRFTYDAHASTGLERMRYSFASIDRSTRPHELVAGEYGRGDMTTRLVRYAFDPDTSLLRADTDGAARPVVLEEGGVPGMQGATVVHGTWFVTTSRGRFRLGSVWVGRPGELRERRHQLPVGPEDITYWPERDQLWSLSEYPGARFVFGMPRERFVGG
jgi:hypothetical protein